MAKNKKLKIIFDTRTLKLKKNGIFFVTINILQNLAKRDDVELILYIPGNGMRTINENLKIYFPNIKFKKFHNCIGVLHEKIKKEKDKKKAKKQYIRKFLLSMLLPFTSILSKIFNRPKSDNICFSPCLKYPQKLARLKKYTLLHDTIPDALPQYAKAKNKSCWYGQLTESLNANDYYFTNSEYTKKDFLKYYPQMDADKIFPTLLACNEDFTPAKVDDIKRIKEKYNIPNNDKYVFILCPLDPRKNVMRVIKTFGAFIKKHNISDLHLILGGGNWHTWNALLDETISSLGELSKTVIKAGVIPDEDLPILYSGAEFFVYTSQYEGFGLPPLEAMSCGCPVITSNNSSLPEVVGDAGIMIDWDSDQQHIEAYEKYYFNEILRKENAQKGLERAKQFSWKKCVDKMVEVMKNNV